MIAFSGQKFANSDYGRVWQGTDLAVKFDSKGCQTKHEECQKKGLIEDDICPVERICPVNAFTTKGAVLDRKLCFNCGACVRTCVCGCFKMTMGEVVVDGHNVPITLRQSDKTRALKLARRLKDRILDRSFTIYEKMEALIFNK